MLTQANINMKIEVKYIGGILNLPSSVLPLIKNADETELKVLLGIFNYAHAFSGFDTCVPMLSKDLDIEIAEINRALAFWAKNGVLSVEGLDSALFEAIHIDSSEKNSMPTYTGEQITAFIKENKEIETLFSSCQSVMGKTFNTHDYNSIIYLRSFYKFSDEYILFLLAHCVESDKANWAYIRKTAKILYDEGVDTYEKLEKHFSARRNKRSLEYKIRKLFGIGEREFTKREKDIFETWINQKISFDLIKKAYEVTIDNTGKPSSSYTAKIIENWLNAGIKTPEEAENSLVAYKNRLSMSSFDTDDFFEAALKRSQEEFKKGSKK